MAYFHNTLASEKGISGDDLNRRHRESRLGYAAPSADWADCNKEIRCIYPYGIITRFGLDGRELYVHKLPAFFNPGRTLFYIGIPVV